MTRHFDSTFEGASLTGSQGATSTAGTVSLESTSQVKDTYSAQTSTASSLLRYDWTATATIFLSFYVKVIGSFAGNMRTVHIKNGSTQLARLDIRTTGKVRLLDPSSTQIGSDSTLTMVAGNLYRIGVRVTQGTGSNGIIEGFIAANDDAFGSAFASTSAAANTLAANRIDVGNTTSGTANDLKIDNVRIDDTSMPGPDGGSTEVTTNYTAGAVIATVITNNYTAGAVIAQPVTTAYTAAAVLAKVENIAYTAGAVLSGPITTQYTAGAALQGTITTAYTAAAQLANQITVAYTAGASLSSSPVTTYTAGAVLSGLVIQPFYPDLVSNPYSETSFWLCDQYGVLLAILESTYYLGGSYQLGLNSVTELQLALPGDFPYELLVRDGWIYPVRSIAGRPAQIDGKAVFFLRQRSKGVSPDGQRFVELKASSGLGLASRRIVAFDAETSQSDKTGAADNLVKEFFRENYGASAAAARNASQYLTIPANTSLAPSVSYSGSRKTLSQVLADLGTASANAGTALYYDILLESTTSKKVILEVWPRFRGADRTRVGGTGEVMLSSETGAIGNVSLVEDFSRSWNYVYATGKGQTVQRVIKTAEDAGLSKSGPFSLIEAQVNANSAQHETQVQLGANSHLRKGRPAQVFAADVIDVSLYGRKLFLGDLVNAEFEGSVFDVMVAGVSVTVGGGPDKIKTLLRAQ